MRLQLPSEFYPPPNSAKKRVLELRALLLETWQDLQPYVENDPKIKRISDRIGLELNQPEFSLLE